MKFAGAVKKIPAREMTIMQSKIGNNGGMVPFLIGNEKGKRSLKPGFSPKPVVVKLSSLARPKKKEACPV